MTDKWKKITKDGYALIINEGGATLGVSTATEKNLLFQDDFAFKDLNRNGVLDPYEDWRLPMAERIADLAARMSIEEIAGLMLYSAHQSICRDDPLARRRYAGHNAPDTREHVWNLSEAQQTFLRDDNLRHVLVAMVENTPTAAKWNNEAQAFVERLGLGIPVNISSDPRHLPRSSAEFDMGAGGDISHWPDNIGLAATFDATITRRFGEIASKEYRAMGITTALSPQIDLATDPRWFRFTGTFGEGAQLAVDMARAYCDGFQTSEGARAISDGWGYDSVNAMVKHWPGGGSGEAGRDAHFAYGKYAVYPGENFAEHLRPFIEGAFKLAGKTGMASAVMPYYTISWGIDTKNGENVGNSYSRYIISDLLREKYGYDGVVCTDWLITRDATSFDSFFSGKCWGVETLSVAARHYKILMAGVDQFGGNNEKGPVLEAYALGAAEHGEEFMKKRFELSAKRLLTNIFRCGLFENPYLDAEESRKTVGCAEFTQAGYEAQLKSVVMLKNKVIQGRAALPLAAKTRVYIPKRHIDAGRDWFGMPTPARDVVPVNPALVSEYFVLVDDPAQADCALCFIESPKSDGYLADKGGYLPISLQYRPWTASCAREKSIAGADARSYRGKTGATNNESDLDLVLDTKAAMGARPVIVVVKTSNPFVAREFESSAAALLLDFCVEARALFAIISGKAEPSALLPFQMPADMETVESQCEDVPRDMACHVDESGNRWDFAFGLNWAGVVNDERVRKYR